MNKIIITRDKSNTIFNEQVKESYHSLHGALTESLHVFIKTGLHFFGKKKINLLEIGLGTGLNAFLTLKDSIEKNIEINYVAIEPYPLSYNLIKKLNYSSLIKIDEEKIKKIHLCDFDKPSMITSRFMFVKYKKKLENLQIKQKFNLIYFDAFSPTMQPKIWNKSNFSKLYAMMKKKSILVTYCSKGKVRRDLESLGFIVEKIKGPPGKREIIRVKK